MAVKQINSDVYFVGALDWDRRIFDELIPLPNGTSYNSYIIKGSEKTALIDTVDPTKEKVLVENLKHLKIEKIDYIISNHAEQDHSGSIPKILELYPEAKVVTNPKCKEMLKTLLLFPDDVFIEVSDRETVSLGDKNLEFIYAPWVHWPETMLTYLKEDNILFTCDFFGSHYATSELFVSDEAEIIRAAKRYYAEIMMPFKTNIRRHLEKLSVFNFDIIAPSHGPIYNMPEMITSAYTDWVSDEVKKQVIIPYVSMHGSTQKIVEYFSDVLIEKNIEVTPFNLTRTDIGELAIALVDAACLVVASPTVLTGAHPSVVSAVYLINALRPKLKYFSIIGSYGWGGKMIDQITGMLSNLKAEQLEPVLIKGYPDIEDFELLKKLADEITKKLTS